MQKEALPYKNNFNKLRACNLLHALRILSVIADDKDIHLDAPSTLNIISTSLHGPIHLTRPILQTSDPIALMQQYAAR